MGDFVWAQRHGATAFCYQIHAKQRCGAVRNARRQGCVAALLARDATWSETAPRTDGSATTTWRETLGTESIVTYQGRAVLESDACVPHGGRQPSSIRSFGFVAKAAASRSDWSCWRRWCLLEVVS